MMSTRINKYRSYFVYVLFTGLIALNLVILVSIYRGSVAATKNKITAATIKNEVVFKKIFPLSVRDNQVIAADGTPYIIRGVTTSGFRYSWPNEQYATVNDLIAKIDIVRAWGANTVQLYLNPAIFDDTEKGTIALADLTRVVNWGRQKDMLIILNPVNDVPWDYGNTNKAMRTEDGLRKRDLIRYVLAQLAGTFCEYPNVMLGLEAEPKFIDTVQTIHERISAIQNCQNPFLIPMVNFSGLIDFEQFMLTGIDTDNIILDYHAYNGADNESPGLAGELTEFNQLHINAALPKKYPIIFGEFGGFWKSDFNTDQDLAHMVQVADFAHARGIGIVTFALDDWVFAALDEQGSITDRGSVIQKILAK